MQEWNNQSPEVARRNEKRNVISPSAFVTVATP
jgi:hypothetical protein